MYGFIDFEDTAVATYRFRVRFYDGIEGRFRGGTLLATGEHQCTAWANKECAKEHRMREYGNEGRKDSLQIFKLEEITLPYIESEE